MIEENARHSDIRLLMQSYEVNDPEELVKAILNGPSEDDMLNDVSKEKRLVFAIDNYIENCKQDPHKVIYYIIKSIAEGELSIDSSKDFFEKYLNDFPAVEFLQGLSEKDCQDIMKENPDAGKFQSFFLYKIMNDERVQKRIVKTASEISVFRNGESVNWQAILLYRLSLEAGTENTLTGIRGALKKLLGNKKKSG
jgi:hypothetical protein